jgi:hypothetical protein
MVYSAQQGEIAMYFAIQAKVFNPASQKEEWLPFALAQSPNVKLLLGNLLNFAKHAENIDICRIKRIDEKQLLPLKRQAEKHQSAGLFDCLKCAVNKNAKN